MTENKFGMFIHWGIYSILGLHEQALARYSLDKEKYEALMHSFNPEKYDPEKWVLLAKEAGMKYIVFTSKHQEGFCMFKSDVDNYNIVDATPFGRDVVDELAKACRKHGIKLGLYYSQELDFHEQ